VALADLARVDAVQVVQAYARPNAHPPPDHRQIGACGPSFQIAAAQRGG
jgi:hypothetical protein